jgi:hypothetical protein
MNELSLDIISAFSTSQCKVILYVYIKFHIPTIVNVTDLILSLRGKDL